MHNNEMEWLSCGFFRFKFHWEQRQQQKNFLHKPAYEADMVRYYVETFLNS